MFASPAVEYWKDRLQKSVNSIVFLYDRCNSLMYFYKGFTTVNLTAEKNRKKSEFLKLSYKICSYRRTLST